MIILPKVVPTYWCKGFFFFFTITVHYNLLFGVGILFPALLLLFLLLLLLRLPPPHLSCLLLGLQPQLVQLFPVHNSVGSPFHRVAFFIG